MANWPTRENYRKAAIERELEKYKCLGSWIQHEGKPLMFVHILMHVTEVADSFPVFDGMEDNELEITGRRVKCERYSDWTDWVVMKIERDGSVRKMRKS